MAPMSTSDCFVSRYTVPRKLSGIDSCMPADVYCKSCTTDERTGFHEHARKARCKPTTVKKEGKRPAPECMTKNE